MNKWIMLSITWRAAFNESGQVKIGSGDCTASAGGPIPVGNPITLREVR